MKIHRRYGRSSPANSTAPPVRIKPGADPRLRPVFALIGAPEPAPFRPDPFQLDAVAAMDRGDCLVTAPTGSGKTWIAEQAIAATFQKGGRTWYASPLKALSNSKYIEFSNIFGSDHVGILTGDRQENSAAPIIVGTTEILRNQLYDAMHRGKDLDADVVILDEAHFLGDRDRGVVWEEIMIYLPVRIPLLMLSATIGNAPQIARWLTAIRSRPCNIIEENTRPVPLFTLFLHPSGMLYPLMTIGGTQKKSRIYGKVLDYAKMKNPPRFSTGGRLPPFGDVLRVLKKYNLLPAIFFLKSRADCNNALNLCTTNILDDPDRQKRIHDTIQTFIDRYPHIAKHSQIYHLEKHAIGAHHSGQLPAWKLLLEELLTEGLLDAVFATSTVSAGVNFPARSVAFLNSDRFNGTEFLPLTSTEFHQMTGRAGRRGMDRIGFAIVVPDKFMDVRLISNLVHAPASNVNSQIRINFSMVLNLLLSHTPPQIEDLLKNSFASYLLLQDKSRATARNHLGYQQQYVWEDFERHLEFLKETQFVSDINTLTEDGIWASRLRVDQPLLIAEGFRLGLFPETDPALLAAIIASFVNEKESDERIAKRFIPKPLLTAFLNVKKKLRPFSAYMMNRGFEVRMLFLRPSAAVYAWASGNDWDTVIQISEIQEGDLAMLMFRTADNLRHIRALADTFPGAAESASKAIALILKDPVIDKE